MTRPDPMPDNPGDPDQTDPEVTTPDGAEEAADEAARAADEDPEATVGQPDGDVDPAVEAEIEEALADIDAEFEERTNPDHDGDGLPVLDDLDLARQHGDLETGPLKALGDKLTETLTGFKLEPFGAEGDAFDPEIHEAVQDLSAGEDKAVGTVLRRGYRVGDRLVRTAMVIIADPAPAAE